MAPTQVITTPQKGPKTMPLAIVRNSAGNGTNECMIISPIEPNGPQAPSERIKLTMVVLFILSAGRINSIMGHMLINEKQKAVSPKTDSKTKSGQLLLFVL